MKLIKILLFIWQLPQILLGYIIVLFTKHNLREVEKIKDITYYYVDGFPGGISLGTIVILNGYYLHIANPNIVKHEYGHTVQSKILGWFYLLIIGLPSITWAWLYGNIIKITHNGYYRFYTEKWADKLGKVKRD